MGHSSRSSFHHRSSRTAGSDLISSTISLLSWQRLSFSKHPWDKLRANLSHLQFVANNCVYSSHTDIKLCTYCLYRHTTVLIHEILYLACQLWCIGFLIPPTPLIIPHRLPAFLESLMLLKNWCSIHARWSKSSLKHSIRFCDIFSKNFIAYHSSKVSSRPDCIFEIHQLWQSGFSRMYSNCFCSCSFEPKIIKIGQSSHKIYSNNILNFQESTTILNARTKKSGNLLKAPCNLKIFKYQQHWHMKQSEILKYIKIKLTK